MSCWPLSFFDFGSKAMPQRETFLTAQGLKQLQAELQNLKGIRRQEVAARIHRASETGGTVDNAEYDEAKSEQAFVEGRIRELENILANAVVATHDKKAGIVTIGSAVTVTTDEGRKQKYMVVGSVEAAPLDGKISNESPVGRALLGHKVGDVVEFETPSKKKVKLTVNEVK
jgi:transcription elongation factor GreA